MQNNKFLSLIGMARRANKVYMGFDKAKSAMIYGEAKVVFVCSDISEKTKRGLIFASEETGVPVIDLPYTIFEISNAIGTKCGVVAVTDKGFADKLVTLI